MAGRSWYLLAAVGVIVASGVMWLVLSRAQAPEQVRVTRGAAVQVVYATGVVEAEVQAQVAAEVSGRLVERYVNEGDAVRQSAPLARLYDAEQYAEVSELMIREVNEQTHLNRARDLLDRHVGSREDYDNAKAALEQVSARLAAARVRLQQRTLTAPFDGLVLRRDHEIGETVAAGQILFVIGQARPLRATIEVDEEDYPLVQAGQKVLLSNDAFPGQVFAAQVTEMTPLGDSASKTYRVRARLPDDTPLPVGMTLEANVVVAEHPDVLLLPSAALQGDEAFRPDRTPVQVRTGIRGMEMTEITGGASEGDVFLATPPAAAGH